MRVVQLRVQPHLLAELGEAAKYDRFGLRLTGNLQGFFQRNLRVAPAAEPVEQRRKLLAAEHRELRRPREIGDQHVGQPLAQPVQFRRA